MTHDHERHGILYGLNHLATLFSKNHLATWSYILWVKLKKTFNKDHVMFRMNVLRDWFWNKTLTKYFFRQWCYANKDHMTWKFIFLFLLLLNESISKRQQVLKMSWLGPLLKRHILIPLRESSTFDAIFRCLVSIISSIFLLFFKKCWHF